ncbi:MAG: HAMP domain-containing protein [Alphaproteobacteria bacterium]|nr:HAMP domain-containing protein [Alphaproteobacteria bacterium]MBT5860329.1 HAMP domain-containing protein [Alphaproteobacteria bacterium]
MAPARAAQAAPGVRPRPRPRPKRLLSPLTIRILLLNIPALGILLGGALFLGNYRDGLVEAKIEGLITEGAIIAGALGQSAAPPVAGPFDQEIARALVLRLAVTSDNRARLFDVTGRLIADSRQLGPAALEVEARDLAPPGADEGLGPRISRAFDWLLRWSLNEPRLPPYKESGAQTALDYGEVMVALTGEVGTGLRQMSDGEMIVTVALPVQRFKLVLGALMLSAGAADIEVRVREVRIAILQVFGLAFLVTVLLSIYLSGTIARPVRKLAVAAQAAGSRKSGRNIIPDFTGRHDEIGDLSGALRDMTDALYDRLDAIEAFAADVAHEIKNPLSSIRSAVEGIENAAGPDQEAKLIAIIVDDVRRLDRLISDISDASRLGAELARAESTRVDLVALLETLVDIHRTTSEKHLRFEFAAAERFSIPGIEDRIGQVMRNLIANAISFSPENGRIGISVGRVGTQAEVVFEDEGPGIPEEKREAVFDRFYSERPEGEAFGTHSGLGLSISRQIVEAHGGSIRVENRHDAGGAVQGARFIVTLPAEG